MVLFFGITLLSMRVSLFCFFLNSRLRRVRSCTPATESRNRLVYISMSW